MLGLRARLVVLINAVPVVSAQIIASNSRARSPF
jgi:hypothetical protein